MSANNRTRVLYYFVQWPPDAPIYLYLNVHICMHDYTRIRCIIPISQCAHASYDICIIIMNNRSARETIMILIIPHGLNATFVIYYCIFYYIRRHRRNRPWHRTAADVNRARGVVAAAIIYHSNAAADTQCFNDEIRKRVAYEHVTIWVYLLAKNNMAFHIILTNNTILLRLTCSCGESWTFTTSK